MRRSAVFPVGLALLVNATLACSDACHGEIWDTHVGIDPYGTLAQGVNNLDDEALCLDCHPAGRLELDQVPLP